MIDIYEYVDNQQEVIKTEIYGRLSFGTDILKAIYAVSIEEDIIVRKLKGIQNLVIDYNKALNAPSKIKKELETLIEFKNSNIGIKIKNFIECNNAIQLDEIKSEIENDNPFNIKIIDRYFNIFSVGVCYSFNRFDIDNDIQNMKNNLHDDINSAYEEIDRLSSLIKLCFEKYGKDFCLHLADVGYIRRCLYLNDYDESEDYEYYREEYYAADENESEELKW